MVRDYKKIIDNQIISQMKERIDKEDAAYFDEFKGIRRKSIILYK